MFRSAKALDRAKTHASFRQAMDAYRKTAENWYDGSVDAIDRRIAHVDKLLHHIRATVARMDFADSATQLREAQTLSADRSALVEFKRTLLTGAADYSTWNKDAGRHDDPEQAYFDTYSPEMKNEFDNMTREPRISTDAEGVGRMVNGPPATEGESRFKHRAAVDSLPSADRRWVTLESSRFVSANTDCLSDPEELATRAQHHAAIKTSTFTRQHSAEVTRAFVSSVVELGKKTYRPSPVKTAAVDIGFDPEALFL